jgi:prepilin peptidase CpaA
MAPMRDRARNRAHLVAGQIKGYPGRAEFEPVMTLDIIRLMLFPTLMAFAAASDLLTMTISNRISLALILGFALLAGFGGMTAHDIMLHLGAGAVVLVVAFTFFAMGWVGGGDAKLTAAIALWFGFAHLMDYLVYASIAGGVLTFLIIQFRKWPLPAAVSGQTWVQRLHETNGGIPYGIALAIGALMIYPETEWMKAVDLAHLAMR